jgi:hypothetical protein
MQSIPTHTVSASAIVPARAERTYGILADYRSSHPSILPPQFQEVIVERGGVGAGTLIRFRMRLLGATRTYRAAITEPEPGRVLVETDLDTNGAVTTFTVDPVEDASKSRVSISTSLPVRTGVAGMIERRLTTWLLRPIYSRELENLSAMATR